MEIRKEDEKYVLDCLASINRDWIEPRIQAVKDSYDNGYEFGKAEGYNKGLKENKIIFRD